LVSQSPLSPAAGVAVLFLASVIMFRKLYHYGFLLP
jgi:hypothetical protein